MNEFKKIITKLSNFSEIDFHVGITLLFRFWSILVGGILLVSIPFYLTGAEQGYYFTFSSLIATQVFFELGFNFVVVQIVSHEMPGLSYGSNGSLSGRHDNVSRLSSLIILLKKWYLLISILYFIIVSIIGFIFFSTNGHLPKLDWLPVWILLVLFSSINLYISPFLAVLEGMGFVGQVAKIRLMQSCVGYGCFFILLLFGAGLYSIVCISGVAALFSYTWLMKTHSKLIKEHHKVDKAAPVISWKKEIFPFQWKIALSWLSGYFIFQLFNPLVFAYQGAVEAGRVGLTLTIFSTILSFSMSWVTAKSPVMAKLIAEEKIVESKILFKKLLFKSGCSNLLIIAGFIVFVLVLRANNIDLAMRIANNNILYILFFVSIANHIVFTMATYMRAYKKEPMIWNSLGTGLLIAVALTFSARLSSTFAIASYAFVIIGVCLPWTIMIYRDFIKINTNSRNNQDYHD